MVLLLFQTKKLIPDFFPFLCPHSSPAWAVPWVSTDAAENEDNNDPNWEILQKLSTDEERYRVVREKWHQLEIPDPRRDLTCNNFRRSQPQVSIFLCKLVCPLLCACPS